MKPIKYLGELNLCVDMTGTKISYFPLKWPDKEWYQKQTKKSVMI